MKRERDAHANVALVDDVGDGLAGDGDADNQAADDDILHGRRESTSVRARELPYFKRLSPSLRLSRTAPSATRRVWRDWRHHQGGAGPWHTALQTGEFRTENRLKNSNGPKVVGGS